MIEEWNKGMVSETQCQFTPKGVLKRPTIKGVCQWIKQSWSRVREDIVKFFKICVINNAVNGSKDHLIYEADNDDIEEEEEEEEER